MPEEVLPTNYHPQHQKLNQGVNSFLPSGFNHNFCPDQWDFGIRDHPIDHAGIKEGWKEVVEHDTIFGINTDTKVVPLAHATRINVIRGLVKAVSTSWQGPREGWTEPPLNPKIHQVLTTTWLSSDTGGELIRREPSGRIKRIWRTGNITVQTRNRVFGSH